MKTKFALIAALLLLITPFAFAENDLPSAGMTPDSPLWGLDLAIEKIQLALTRDPTAKIQKRLENVEERVAEEKAMAESGNEAALDKAELARQIGVGQIKSDIDTKGIPEDVKAKVLENLQKHLTVLQGVQLKLQEKGVNATGISRAITNAQENILRFQNKTAKSGGY